MEQDSALMDVRGWVHRFYMGQTPRAGTAALPDCPRGYSTAGHTILRGATPAVTPSLAAKTGTAPPMSRRIEVRSGPGLRYEVMAEVPSGGSYVVVAQEQEWNRFSSLMDVRGGYTDFTWGRRPQRRNSRPPRLPPWLLHRRPYHPPRLLHRRSRPVL